MYANLRVAVLNDGEVEIIMATRVEIAGSEVRVDVEVEHADEPPAATERVLDANAAPVVITADF